MTGGLGQNCRERDLCSTCLWTSFANEQDVVWFDSGTTGTGSTSLRDVRVLS
jgi:hypothetical protein